MKDGKSENSQELKGAKEWANDYLKRNKENQCLNCHDMELYPDEECPDCGREA